MEQYHSALVPHAGPDSRIFGEACALGRLLPRLAEVDDASVVAPVAIGWDPGSWWALRQPHLPSDRLDYWAALRRAHRALWSAQVTADFADLAADLSGYRLVLVPSHYLADDAVVESVGRYVAGGGTLVVWYFSGIADAHGRVRLGGYPGAFREVLGVRVTEFQPLPPGERHRLDDGSTGTLWSEQVELAGARAVRCYADGGLAGRPAVTRHGYGAGTAWYVSTELDEQAYEALLSEVFAAAGVPGGGLPAGVEVVRRERGGTRWRFILNHTGAAVRVPANGVELLSGERVVGSVTLPAGEFAVRSE